MVAGFLHDELVRRGNHVMVAKNGREAIELLEREDFDYAFIDAMMPYVSGLEVIRWVRSHPTKSNLRVALMSVMADFVSGYICDEIGNLDLISKPIDLSKLFSQDLYG